ncbi:MAG: hypothetical protein ACM3SY_03695 [Candidatus Omnitrophota bacterium]
MIDERIDGQMDDPSDGRVITEWQVREIIERHFQEELETLSEISRDTSHQRSLIVGFDRYKFFNYDKIKNKSYRGNSPKSPDMLLFKDDEIIFVEFKSGRIERRKKECRHRSEDDECKYVMWDIRLKAIEGGFIVLQHVLSKIRADVRLLDIFTLNKTYILVYNDAYENSRKFPFHYCHDPFYAGEVKFGLHIYRKTFFNKIHTFSKSTFVEWLVFNKFIDAPLNERLYRRIANPHGWEVN